jgi:hypothetical protein
MTHRSAGVPPAFWSAGVPPAQTHAGGTPALHSEQHTQRHEGDSYV